MGHLGALLLAGANLLLLFRGAHSLVGLSELDTAPAITALSSRYLVRVDPDPDPQEVEARLASIALKYGDHRSHPTAGNKPVYLPAISTITISLTNETELLNLRKDPLVESVVQDRTIALPTPEKKILMGRGMTLSLWGLDRINQRKLPYDDVKVSDTCKGEGVDVYVLDTGIDTLHPAFEGRAKHYFSVFASPFDLHGHGTHVAGIIGANFYGVAKKVTLYSVKIVDDNGRGDITYTLQGLQSVLNRPTKSRPAIINYSISGDLQKFVTDMFDALIADGVTIVAAAGNEGGQDACLKLQGYAPFVTVGATDKDDNVASVSNLGRCITLFAPGKDITSTKPDSQIQTLTGTSMAAPHVSGAAAMYLSRYPNANPAQVKQALIAASTPDVVKYLQDDTPNRLLYAQFDFTLPCQAAKIRPDGLCGPLNPSPSNTSNGICGGVRPCCSAIGRCSANSSNCGCPTCCDSRVRDCSLTCSSQPPTSIRSDGVCGATPTNGTAECPASSQSCCANGKCILGPCTCPGCVDYHAIYGCPAPILPTSEAAQQVATQTHTVRGTAMSTTKTPTRTTIRTTTKTTTKTTAKATTKTTIQPTRTTARATTRATATTTKSAKTATCPTQLANRVRADLRCGARFPLADGRPSECPASGATNYCCSRRGFCVTDIQCRCTGCSDFRGLLQAPTCRPVDS